MNDKLALMLQELIDKYGYTQAEIANITGVKPPTIHRLLKGKTDDVRYSLGKKIELLHKKTKSKRTD
jgi:transcriptional regulator with XRE-family HTH domain